VVGGESVYKIEGLVSWPCIGVCLVEYYMWSFLCLCRVVAFFLCGGLGRGSFKELDILLGVIAMGVVLLCWCGEWSQCIGPFMGRCSKSESGWDSFRRDSCEKGRFLGIG
jgi:hypothetical protein